jgi:hypothetical protein
VLQSNGLALEINSSTISDNSVVGFSGGGLYFEYGSATLQNSIIANNYSKTEGADCAGNWSITSAGYNLIGSLAGCPFTTFEGDITNIVPNLGPIEGSPAYQPILPGSPAINAGNLNGCADELGSGINVDQRGKPRFNRCDIGAYELQPIEYNDMQADQLTAHPGEEIFYTLTLNNPRTTGTIFLQMYIFLANHLAYMEGSLEASIGQANYQNGVITRTGTLAAQELVTVSYTATVDKLAPLNQLIINTVEFQDNEATFIRQATVLIDPYQIYCPLISKIFP